MGLIRIAEVMRARGIVSVDCRTTDVTSVFSSTASPVLRNITRSGGRVLCVTAEGLAGLMGHEPFPGIRLGKELAEIARTNSLGGIIHSDEFRKQRVSENEESELRKLAGSSETDALILIAGPEDRTAVVSELVAERLGAALKGVPKETRAATDDGETRYLRPRPGAARMYPETDIPEIVITEGWLAELAGRLPVPWEERVRSYVDRYSLSPELSLQPLRLRGCTGLREPGIGVETGQVPDCVGSDRDACEACPGRGRRERVV